VVCLGCDALDLFRGQKVLNHEVSVSHELFPVAVGDSLTAGGAHGASIPIKVD
jgi:hypothetical protein